ncbi:MAG: hypothetical protein J0L75_04905 [Spirochaetes bacterium]|nr:hypothetical protein [Spirochaetota bacterium]
MKFSVRRVSVTRGPGGWQAKELWLSKSLQPNFNDTVIHQGHAYGFVGPRLACIDLRDGATKWQGATYAGFSILLAEQGLLLILTEKGEVALVEARPDKFSELARIPAVTGKTWNHPALAGDVLLARNAQEMVAYQLAPEGAR